MCKRFNILDCNISAENVETAIKKVSEQLKSGDGGYICFSNVHTVVTARNDRELRNSTNNSFMSLPDGKPLSVYARLKGCSSVEQVAGPDFMPLCIKAFPDAKHYFYGSTQETLDSLRDNLVKQFPEISISGMYSPPFRKLSKPEQEEILKNINSVSPDFIWVGLGAPKQEVWMMENHEALKPAILFGVGAAFDFHAGLLKRCPEWMQKSGLEWFYRLMREPGRLWKRYLITNTSFIICIAHEELKTRIFRTKG